MSFRFLSVMLASAAAWAGDVAALRVCADPNNLPFSNEAREGFENRLAAIVARDLGASLEYAWAPQRKSFIKNSLDAGRCDVLMGIPTALPAIEVTKPYYRSTYVFLSRQDRNLPVQSLDDASLEKLRIGIHVVGDDYAPPAAALARRGLAANLAPYSLFGAYGEANPPAKLVHAVERGDVDIAIIWGPFAGYFAKSEPDPLEISPVFPAMFLAVPFTYEMSMGVRKGDDALRDKLDAIIERRCAQIQALLQEYGVPLAPQKGEPKCEPTQPSRSAVSR